MSLDYTKKQHLNYLDLKLVQTPSPDNSDAQQTIDRPAVVLLQPGGEQESLNPTDSPMPVSKTPRTLNRENLGFAEEIILSNRSDFEEQEADSPNHLGSMVYSRSPNPTNTYPTPSTSPKPSK